MILNYLLKQCHLKMYHFAKRRTNNEMVSILSYNSWVSANLPPGSKPIDCKQVFEENELFKLFKLEWFLKVKEKRGIDNFDTFVPVVKITSTRVLIVWVSIYNLNPSGRVCFTQKKKNKARRLVKSLYGLLVDQLSHYMA